MKALEGISFAIEEMKLSGVSTDEILKVVQQMLQKAILDGEDFMTCEVEIEELYATRGRFDAEQKRLCEIKKRADALIEALDGKEHGDREVRAEALEEAICIAESALIEVCDSTDALGSMLSELEQRLGDFENELN